MEKNEADLRVLLLVPRTSEEAQMPGFPRTREMSEKAGFISYTNVCPPHYFQGFIIKEK